MLLISGFIPLEDREELVETFKMIPISLACPYNEVFYDPSIKVLMVVSKLKKDNLQPVTLPSGSDPAKSDSYQYTYTTHEIPLERWYEYEICVPEQIHEFLKLFAFNYSQFDFKKYEMVI